MDGLCLQLDSQPAIVGRGVAKARLTFRLAGAPCQNAQQRVLRIDRHRRTQRQSRRYYAVEDDGPGVSGKSSQVVLCNPGPVRAAVEVDAIVSECCAGPIQILNSDAGGVVSAVGVRTDLLQAALCLCDDPCIRFCGEQIIAQVAIQCVRAPCASLIQQHDVPVAMNAFERRRHR